MDKNSAEIKAMLVASDGLQSSLLKDSIEQHLAVAIELIDPEQLLTPQIQQQIKAMDLVIIDYPAMSEELVEQYDAIKERLALCDKEVLLNTPQDVSHTQLLDWPNLVGLFYASDTLERLVYGFKRILQGELWMSRRLLAEYIHFYRDRQRLIKTSPSFATLTKREQEVIKLLGDGASNTQIAEALHVSENTVKAHLHNTFKKLKVKNRLQALIWAKNNISNSEYV